MISIPGHAQLLSMANLARRRACQNVPRKICEVKIAAHTIWELRFLYPPEADSEQPTKHFLARRGQHWAEGIKPVTCPKTTGRFFGGGREYCPVCEVLERLSTEQSFEIQTVLRDARVRTQWLCWCK